jgi:hypothetical protein
MREIKQQIKNCDIKAPRQVVTCQIPKCLSCSENKGKKRSHKQHCRSITQDDHHPGSNTSIDHVDAANVPGYTWQHKGRPTLKKYKNFMLFVDHKTRLVYPSFQNPKPYRKLVDQNMITKLSPNDTTSPLIPIMLTTAPYDLKHFKNQLITINRN